jgi:hypothetical protein
MRFSPVATMSTGALFGKMRPILLKEKKNKVKKV